MELRRHSRHFAVLLIGWASAAAAWICCRCSDTVQLHTYSQGSMDGAQQHAESTRAGQQNHSFCAALLQLARSLTPAITLLLCFVFFCAAISSVTTSLTLVSKTIWPQAPMNGNKYNSSNEAVYKEAVIVVVKLLEATGMPVTAAALCSVPQMAPLRGRWQQTNYDHKMAHELSLLSLRLHHQLGNVLAPESLKSNTALARYWAALQSSIRMAGIVSQETADVLKLMSEQSAFASKAAAKRMEALTGQLQKEAEQLQQLVQDRPGIEKQLANLAELGDAVKENVEDEQATRARK